MNNSTIDSVLSLVFEVIIVVARMLKRWFASRATPA